MARRKVKIHALLYSVLITIMPLTMMCLVLSRNGFVFVELILKHSDLDILFNKPAICCISGLFCLILRLCHLQNRLA